MEYVVHASAPILFEFLTSPSGLSEWFCDDLNIRNGVFSFVWDGSVQQAKLIKIQEDKHIRFQWMDKPEGTYFEFRIERDDLTGDISLIVTDFADSKDEANSSRLLWDSQIHKLMQVLGSYY
ncbi:MAG: START-like domain-containing protein [Bacteroidia bacterium]